MSDLKKLQLRLEGQTIRAIEPGNAPESICTFVLADGKRFRLHATDLGFWTEDTVGAEGTYDDLTGLMTDYQNHTYDLAPAYKFDLPEPKVSFSEGVLELTAPDGKSFRGTVANFKDEDQRLVHHKEGFRIIASSAEMGNAWMTFLNHKMYPDICPPELSRR